MKKTNKVTKVAAVSSKFLQIDLIKYISTDRPEVYLYSNNYPIQVESIQDKLLRRDRLPPLIHLTLNSERSVCTPNGNSPALSQTYYFAITDVIKSLRVLKEKLLASEKYKEYLFVKNFTGEEPRANIDWAFFGFFRLYTDKLAVYNDGDWKKVNLQSEWTQNQLKNAERLNQVECKDYEFSTRPFNLSEILKGEIFYNI